MTQLTYILILAFTATFTNCSPKTDNSVTSKIAIFEVTELSVLGLQLVNVAVNANMSIYVSCVMMLYFTVLNNKIKRILIVLKSISR